MDLEAARTQVDRFVDDARKELVELCARLVAAPSINPPGDTRGPALVIQEFLGGRGLASETAAKVAEKPNIIATSTGNGPGRHLVFNGHMDTIPPGQESEWSVPIQALTRRDGRLYGLGMGNMKGAVAAMCLAYAYLAANRKTWRGKVTLTAVADETVFGPDGAEFLLETRADLLGDGLICGEGPGFMNVAIAEKGVLWLELVARAPSGQGMLSRRGSSAIARLAAALTTIDGWNDAQTIAPDEVACVTPHAGEHGLRLSANVGTVRGGQFVSQAASRASAEIDFRLPPGLSIADIERRMSDLVTECSDMTWRRIKGWEPNWSPPESDVVRSTWEAAGIVRAAPPVPVVRLPASDASRWRALGTPAVCYGPQPTLVAGVDDYANERDVIDCAKIYALAALRFLD